MRRFTYICTECGASTRREFLEPGIGSTMPRCSRCHVGMERIGDRVLATAYMSLKPEDRARLLKVDWMHRNMQELYQLQRLPGKLDMRYGQGVMRNLWRLNSEYRPKKNSHRRKR